MKRNSSLLWLAAIAILLVPAYSFASDFSPLNTIQSVFSSDVGGIFNAARDLFLGLVGIEVTWFFINLVLNQREFYYIIQQALLKIISIGLYYEFLTVAGEGFSSGNWFYALIHGMASLGQSLGSGQAVGGIQSILVQGVDNAAAIIQAPTLAYEHLSKGDIFPDVKAAITAGVLTIEVLTPALLVLAAYALMALRVFMITVEMNFVLSAGILLLGTGGSRWTSSYARNYINYAVSVAIRMFTIYFVIGVSNKYVNQQSHALSIIVKDMATGAKIGNALATLFSFGMDFFAIALLILLVPKFAAALATGSSSAGAGDILKPAALAVGAMATGGAAMAAGGIGAAKGAMNLANNAAGGTVGGSGGSMSALEAAALYQPPKGGNPPGFGAGGYVSDSGGGGGSGSGGGMGSGSSRGGRSGTLPQPELPPAARARMEWEAAQQAKQPAGGGAQSSANSGGSKVTSGSGGAEVTSGQGGSIAQGISEELAQDASAAATEGAGDTSAATVTQGSGGGSSIGAGTGASRMTTSNGGGASLGSGSGAGKVTAGSGGAATGLGTGSQKVTGGEDLSALDNSSGGGSGGDGGSGGSGGGADTGASPQPTLTPQEKLNQSIDALRQSIEKMNQPRKPTAMDRTKDLYKKAEKVAEHIDQNERISVQGGPNMGHLGSE